MAYIVRYTVITVKQGGCNGDQRDADPAWGFSAEVLRQISDSEKDATGVGIWNPGMSGVHKEVAVSGSLRGLRGAEKILSCRSRQKEGFMSQYVTEFYEDNGGAICAVVYKDGELSNIIPHLEQEQPGSGKQLIEAAQDGWPYADEYSADEFGGMEMQEVVDEFHRFAEARATYLILAVNGSSFDVHEDDMGEAGRYILSDII